MVIEPLDKFFEEVKTAITEHREGKGVELDYVSFGSIEDLNRILTPKRKQLLDTVKKLKPSSLHQLAQALGRDYKNVYKDAILLEKTGFLELRREGKSLKPEVSYDEIEVALKVG
ncbi:hypothetical protein [Hydrogenivirga sp. 128-5-R1-1]|uniref:HVO_A0114 family putative DNA-binding protein n=1 Tax=Hydrogenivirga sp. 128-5-R1-1 TaxID=392423 RepID=UPI00015EF0A6|nr:hypothetical protein [Hydrogenivirga sp. 128-5-R1-1]EDP74656.1 hypothetical protein HG1285_14629 [Hydrogenivirga sp. 128-5-R1-1]